MSEELGDELSKGVNVVFKPLEDIKPGAYDKYGNFVPQDTVGSPKEGAVPEEPMTWEGNGLEGPRDRAPAKPGNGTVTSIFRFQLDGPVTVEVTLDNGDIKEKSAPEGTYSMGQRVSV